MGLQSVLARYEAKLKGTRFSNDIARYNPIHYGRVRKAIEQTGAMGLEGRRLASDARLRRVLKSASRTRYGKHYGGEPADWPILDKRAVARNPDDFICHSLIAVPAATGGTTGTPLRIARSLLSVAAEQAFIDTLLKPGHSFRTDKAAMLRAFAVKDRDDDRPPFGRVTQAGRCLMLSSYHLSHKNAGWFAEELARFRPEILFAYPSMLARLLNVLESHATPPIPIVICSSETMPYGLREEAEHRLSCELVDFYGLAERVCFASSRDGQDYFFSPAYGRTELIVSHERPMPKGFVAARIVATGFWNDVMPLVRYDTGDLAILPEGLSPEEILEIEYGTRPFCGILGRQDETILLPDGTIVYGLNQIPRGIDRASQIQIVQPEPQRIVFNVLPKADFGPADNDALLHNARSRFPASVILEVKLVDRLQQTAAGKTPFVIRYPQAPGSTAR